MTLAADAARDPRLTDPAPGPDGTAWAVMKLEPVSTGAGADAGLAGTEWRQIPTGTFPWYGSVANLTFSADEVQATGGCNTLFGAYREADGRLRAPEIGSTQRLCEEDGLNRMDQLIEATLHDAVLVRDADGLLYLGAHLPEASLPTGWRSDGKLGADATNPGRHLPPIPADGTEPHTFPGPRDE